MKTILWGLFCALGARSVAQIARPSALLPMQAAAYNQEFADIFSCKINPAALAKITQFHAGAYVEKKYLLGALQQYTIITGAPAAGGGWSFSVDYSGLSSYRQWQSTVAFGKKLGKLSLGAQLNYSAQTIDGYGNQGWLTAGVSTLWQLSSTVSTGLQLYRLSGGLFSGSAQERPGYGYSAGLGMLLTAGLLLEGTLTSNEAQPASVLAGLHYKADHRLMASCFFDLTDSRPSMRVKWQAGSFQVGVTGSYHPLLGFSPGVLLAIAGSKKGGL